MTVEFVKEKHIWDNFIDESLSGLLFHKWDYLKITEKYSGYTFKPYGIYKGKELICLFPLFYKRHHGVNTVFSPPPLTVMPHLGFVMSNEFSNLKQSKKESALKLVADEMKNEIQQLSPNYLSLTLVPNLLDIRPFIWDNYETRIHYSYAIDLDRPLDEIWNSLHFKLRGKLRKIAGSGMDLVKSDDIDTFHTLLSERYHDPSLNIPTISKQYLADLISAYPDNIGLYFLHDADGEIRGVVATQEYKRFLLWIGTPKLEADGSGNEYLQWLLIQQAKSNGYRIFENMGANNKDLVSFKSKFNPDLVMYFELQKKDTLGTFSEWAYLNLVKKTMMRMGLV